MLGLIRRGSGTESINFCVVPLTRKAWPYFVDEAEEVAAKEVERTILLKCHLEFLN